MLNHGYDILTEGKQRLLYCVVSLQARPSIIRCRREPLNTHSESDFLNYRAKSQQFTNTIPSLSPCCSQVSQYATYDLGPSLQRSGLCRHWRPCHRQYQNNVRTDSEMEATLALYNVAFCMTM